MPSKPVDPILSSTLRQFAFANQTDAVSIIPSCSLQSSATLPRANLPCRCIRIVLIRPFLSVPLEYCPIIITRVLPSFLINFYIIYFFVLLQLSVVILVFQASRLNRGPLQSSDTRAKFSSRSFFEVLTWKLRIRGKRSAYLYILYSALSIRLRITKALRFTHANSHFKICIRQSAWSETEEEEKQQANTEITILCNKCDCTYEL